MHFRHGLELHIVSHNKIYPDFATAVNYRRGVAVLGVLYHVSAVDHRSTKPLNYSHDYNIS